jgi:YVTN family beta-propeller protein
VAPYVTIPVCAAQVGVAVSPNGWHLYATNSGSNSVSVIETSTRTVIPNPITFGYYPSGVFVTPNGAQVYMTNSGSTLCR